MNRRFHIATTTVNTGNSCATLTVLPHQQSQQHPVQFHNRTICAIITFCFVFCCVMIFVPTPTTATTLVAIQYDHGIVIGADTRTSSQSYVSHTHNRYKLIPLNQEVILARAGSSARTQQLVRQLQQIQQMQFLKYNRILSVSQLAYCVRNIVHASTESSSSSSPVELLMAGIDRRTQQCFIYTITSSGAIINSVQGTGTGTGTTDSNKNHYMFATSGSGSTYITGYLQEQCQKLSHTKSSTDTTTSATESTTSLFWTELEAIQVCRRAIEMAIHNDAASGGDICIYTISTKPQSTTTTTTTSTNDGNHNDSDDHPTNNDNDNYHTNDSVNMQHPIAPIIQQRQYTYHRPMSRDSTASYL